MPTYDYECEKCGHTFEAFHSMSAEPLKECPKCNEAFLIKLIGSGSAAIIKGTNTPCRGEPKKPKRDIKLKKLGSEPTETPPWRSSKDGKIRKDILKDPQKYIKTGEV